MPTNFPQVLDLTLQQFLDGLTTTVLRQDETFPDPAPNAWKDRMQETVHLNSASEFVVMFHVMPGGTTANIRIDPKGATGGVESIQGVVDLTKLAALLV